MDLFSELITAVQSDLTIGDESSLFPLATVKLAINRAYRKAGGMYRWPSLEDAKKTSTVNGQEYYDALDTWRPDSIWRLEVDGDQWGETPDGSPMTYDDYLTWRADDDNANSTDKKWGVQWLRYFIFPVPTTNGNNNISIWGFKNVETLTNNSDTTIFSYSMPECNEAIVLEATAILKNKGEDLKSKQFLSTEALAIITRAWIQIKQEQAKYEKTQPFFHVDDMFGRSKSKQIIGNFD
jgi:hypothetical protein